MSRLAAVSSLLTLYATTASAHGRITKIATDYGTYDGWDPAPTLNETIIPDLVAWSASNLGNIYVTPADFASDNITCHYNAEPGRLEAKVDAGKAVRLQWNEWPTSHKGPVLTYIAPCNGSCADVAKEDLRFEKIEEQGWVNGSDPTDAGLGGTWASDILISNNFTWTTTIPPSLDAGSYVLRHEIFALHVAEEPNGAQSYPQCVNIEVINSASARRQDDSTFSGVLATTFYKPTDPGIKVNIHGNVTAYAIPGPKLWKESVPQPQSHGLGAKMHRRCRPMFSA